MGFLCSYIYSKNAEAWEGERHVRDGNLPWVFPQSICKWNYYTQGLGHTFHFHSFQTPTYPVEE